MSKPIVKIKDAFIWNNRLCGKPLDYPEEHNYRPGAVTNGKEVYTSPIINVNDTIVETQRTIYEVQNWITGV